MGYLAAADFASRTDLETAVRWHFASNCFPPVPDIQVAPALAAIESAQDEEYDNLIELPEGVTHVRYGTSVPAHVLIEVLHLEAFVQQAWDSWEDEG